MKNIFFEINFFSFLKILFIKQNVYLISDNNNFYINILKKILKKKFYVIKVDTSNIRIKGENIHFVSDRLSKKYTEDLTNKIIKFSIFKNQKFDNFFFEIKHVISKYIYDDLTLLVLKIETTKYIFKGKKTIYVNNLDTGILDFLNKIYPFKIISNSNFKRLKNIPLITFKLLVFNFFKKLFFIFNIQKSIFSKNSFFSILVNTDNVISFSNSRNDFFYIKKKNHKIILSTKINSSTNVNELNKNNSVVMNNKDLLIFKDNLFIKKKIDYIFQDIFNSNLIKKNFDGLFIKFNEIKYLSKKIYPIFFAYNIKYVVNVSYSSNISLALEFLKKIIQYKTITYQYSFMREPNPTMSSSSDHMMIFSNYFRQIFENNYTRPKKILEGGYIYSLQNKKKKSFIKNYKKKFDLKGKFVVSFFDENFNEGMWTLVNKKEMQKNYELLSNFILKNKDIVVLIKPQFLKNIPSKIFKSDLINEALKTKRFIEFFSVNDKKNCFNGRNDILPQEAAMLSNITISLKFGATTSLESGLVNCRNIMINDKGFKDPLDKYFKKNIEFKDFKKALDRILVYKKNLSKKKYDNLGNWSFIIKKILKLKNKKFVPTMQKLLN